MTYLLYQHNEFINRIEADKDFVDGYCEEMGYTYRLEENPIVEPTEPSYTEAQVLGQYITDNQLERISMGQVITNLELMVLEAFYNA